MKESLNKLRFVLRYALKNVFYHPMRSLLIIVGFLALSTSLLLGTSLSSFFNVYFYGELEEKYGSLDLKMSASPSSSARFFSTRDLSDASLDSIVIDFVPFFEIDILIETEQNDRFYVHLYSSSLTQFKKVSYQEAITKNALAYDEMIITASMAELYQLNINDQLTLYSRDLSRTYRIAEIVTDGKMFKGQAIYIDKSASFNFFLESLSPGLASLNPASLVNIHNTVYINLHDGISFNDAIEHISALSAYESLNFDILIDPVFVNETINRNISAFNMIISVIILAVILVLYTTLITYFDDKRKMFAVIETLGGKKRFSYSIIIVEMFIFFSVSLLLAVIASNQVIVYGLKALQSSVSYVIPLRFVLLVALINIVLFMLSSFIFFKQYSKNAVIQQTKDHGHEVGLKIGLCGFISLLSMSLYFILDIAVLQNFFSFTKAFYQVLLSVLFMLSTGFFISKVVIQLLHRKKNPFILSLHLKTLFSKRALYQYISVLLISFLSIYLIVAINGYMKIRQHDYQHQYHLDLVVTNVIQDFELTFDEINALEQVEMISRVGLFQDASIIDYSDAIHDFVSIHPSHINTFFNLNISEVSLNALYNDYPVILLPASFKYLHRLNEGDTLIVDLGKRHEGVTFVIGGFFEKQLNDLAFSNISFIDEENYGFNAFFINAKTDKYALNNLLLDMYSSKLIYIIDYEVFVIKLVNDMKQITSYLNTIIFVILFCFTLSIINHSYLLFNQMKSVYARLFVLGYSIKKMNNLQWIESLFVFFILLLISITTYLMIGTKLNQFILFFGSYEPITFDLHSLWIGSTIIFILFVSTKVFYMIKLSKIQPQAILKTF